MKHQSLFTTKRIILCLSIVLGVLYVLRPLAHAEVMLARSLESSTSTPSAAAVHTIGFDYFNYHTVGSVLFEYCTVPMPTTACDAPAGVDVSGTALTSQSGETGFSVASKTANSIVFTRPSVAVSSASSSYTLSGIINPSVALDAYYVRISYFASEDASGGALSRGAVATNISEDIQISTIVPPILYFCVATSIPTDCTDATGNFLQLGNFTSSSTSAASSELMAYTNADYGYSIYATGTTMTSGINVIPALSTPSPSVVGTSQFGLNLRDNTTPDVGANPIGVGIATPTNDYAVPDLFKFVNGDVVASSNDVSDYVKFTASYIVNVADNQKPGVYSTTLTYIIVATF